MYNNDLPSVLSNPCLFFTDDTEVYSCVNNKARIKATWTHWKVIINLNFQTLPYLYNAIVRPTLEYGNIIWGPFLRVMRISLNKSTRLVSHLSYEEWLRHLNLPSLKYR